MQLKQTNKQTLLQMPEMISFILESDRHWESWDDRGVCPGPGTGSAAISI